MAEKGAFAGVPDRSWLVSRGLLSRLSVDGQAALILADREADRLGELWVASGHLLAGLVGVGESGAARVLDALGITLPGLRAELARIDNRRTVTWFEGLLLGRPEGERRLTRDARRILTRSAREARRFGHRAVTPEHILLGLARDAEANKRLLARLAQPELVRILAASELYRRVI
jgi:ATP-dependent Clp protease ATP-binding subunit ClpC